MMEFVIYVYSHLWAYVIWALSGIVATILLDKMSPYKNSFNNKITLIGLIKDIWGGVAFGGVMVVFLIFAFIVRISLPKFFKKELF